MRVLLFATALCFGCLSLLVLFIYFSIYFLFSDDADDDDEVAAPPSCADVVEGEAEHNALIHGLQLIIQGAEKVVQNMR